MATSSLLSEGGWGKWIAAEFKKETGVSIEWIEVDGSGAMISKLGLLKLQPETLPHMVLGLRESDVGRLAKMELLEVPAVWPDYPVARWSPGMSSDRRWLPYSVSIYAWMADLELLKKRGLLPPRSLRDFKAPRYRKQWVTQDPAVSAPGVALKEWQRITGVTLNAAEDAYVVASSWSDAYPLLVEGKVPIVWSYLSSEAYHRSQEQKDPTERRFRALDLREGSPAEWEGLVWTVRARNCGEACLQFSKWIVSERAQVEIPERLWTYPARAVSLPDSFAKVVLPKKLTEMMVE